MENKLEKVMVRKGVRGWESRKGLLDAEEATMGKIVSGLDSVGKDQRLRSQDAQALDAADFQMTLLDA